MCENMVEPWRMCMAYRIPQATDAHSEHVILIDFPLQQWLYERASMLRYTYIACLVIYRPFLWARNCSAHSLFLITGAYWGCRFAFVRAHVYVCARVRMHSHYMHTLISVNIMLLILAMIPSLSIMHSLSDCAVGLKTGSTTHCSTTHGLPVGKCHYLHYSSLTTILVFYCCYCYLFLCDICWGFGTERESTKRNIETMNVVYCMTYTDVHKQTRLHSSLFGLVPFLVSCMWQSNTIGL
jgi:hypothetical protein